MNRIVAISLAAALCGCTFEAALPDQASLSCSDDAECAPGSCLQGRCQHEGITAPTLQFELPPRLEEDTDVSLVATTDVPAAVFGVVITRLPEHGVLLDASETALCRALPCLASATFTYRPDADFFGTDEIEAHAIRTDAERSDGQPLRGDDVKELLEVQPINDAPMLVIEPVDVDEDSSVTQDLIVIDVDGDIPVVDVAQAPSNGVLEIEVGSPADSFRYTPALNFFGVDNTVLRATDSDGESATLLVPITVRPIDDDPILVGPTSVTLDEDTLLAIALPVQDPDGDALSISILVQPARALPFDAAHFVPEEGLVVYEPLADAFGTDTFEFEARDADGAAVVGSVQVTILPRPDAPRVAGAISITSVGRQQSARLVVTEPDTDPANPLATEIVELSIARLPTVATATIDSDGNVLLDPIDHLTQQSDFLEVRANNPSGEESFTIIPINVIGLESCSTVATLLRRDGLQPGSGQFLIGGANPYPAHCDLDRLGGGFELALKVRGRSPLFGGPRRERLTDGLTYRTDAVTLDSAEAKLNGALRTIADDVMVGAIVDAYLPFRAMVVQLSTQQRAPLDALLQTALPVSRGLSDWLHVLDLADDRCGVVVSGSAGFFDVAGRLSAMEVTDPAQGVCTSNTPRTDVAGLGLLPVEFALPVDNGAVLSNGSVAIPIDMVVFVRTRDLRSLGSAASCDAHEANGAFISGTYLVNGVETPCIYFSPLGFCGDGLVDPGEGCDDGNSRQLDGCSATDPNKGWAGCQAQVCGDSIQQEGEECELNGVEYVNFFCTSACTLESLTQAK